ncbi:MAG: PH domain-containing protein, partial [Planctomycetota bacterium]
DIPVRLAYLVPACMVIALLRVYLACLQWMKRVYILTNRRVIRFRGLFRTEIFDCPLTGIQSASLSQSSGERFFRVASLFFEIPGMEPDAGVWLHLPRPHDVEEIVQQALRQSRR